MNIFIIQSLQLSQWHNIASCIISLISVWYGFSGFLAMASHPGSYPFSKTLWALLANAVDVFLRSLFICYIMTFMKALSLLIPFLYFILTFIIVCVRRRSGKCKKNLGIAGYTMISFGCSAFEGFIDEDFDEDDFVGLEFRIRPISKIVFAIILVGFSIQFGNSTAPGLLSNDLKEMNSTFKPGNCSNLCPRPNFNITELEDLKARYSLIFEFQFPH